MSFVTSTSMLIGSSALGVLQQLGVDSKLIEDAKSHGISVAHVGDSLVLTVPSTLVTSAPIVTKVLITFKALALLKQGIMGPASKQQLCSQVSKAIADAIVGKQTNGNGDNQPPPSSDIPIPPKGTKVATPKVASPKVDGWADAIGHLDHATSCLQPVHGTSHGSVYFVVAMFDGLNLAVRRKGGSLSVRAAGSKFSEYVPRLESVGMEVSGNSGYASVHFKVKDDATAELAVGAIMSRIGMGNLLQCTNVWGEVSK